MLTKQDLKAIGDLMDERLDRKLNEYDKKMDIRFKQELAPMGSSVSEIKKQVKIAQKDVREIKIDMRAIINVFDSDIHNHDKRIKRIEDKLQLPLIS